MEQLLSEWADGLSEHATCKIGSTADVRRELSPEELSQGKLWSGASSAVVDLRFVFVFFFSHNQTQYGFCLTYRTTNTKRRSNSQAETWTGEDNPST